MNKIVLSNRLLGYDASDLRINSPFFHKGGNYEVKEVTKHNDDLIVKIWNFDLKYMIKAIINLTSKRIVRTETIY
jgi:hypothetical protein